MSLRRGDGEMGVSVLGGLMRRRRGLVLWVEIMGGLMECSGLLFMG